MLKIKSHLIISSLALLFTLNGSYFNSIPQDIIDKIDSFYCGPKKTFILTHILSDNVNKRCYRYTKELETLMKINYSGYIFTAITLWKLKSFMSILTAYELRRYRKGFAYNFCTIDDLQTYQFAIKKGYVKSHEQSTFKKLFEETLYKYSQENIFNGFDIDLKGVPLFIPFKDFQNNTTIEYYFDPQTRMLIIKDDTQTLLTFKLKNDWLVPIENQNEELSKNLLKKVNWSGPNKRLDDFCTWERINTINNWNSRIGGCYIKPLCIGFHEKLIVEYHESDGILYGFCSNEPSTLSSLLMIKLPQISFFYAYVPKKHIKDIFLVHELLHIKKKAEADTFNLSDLERFKLMLFHTLYHLKLRLYQIHSKKPFFFNDITNNLCHQSIPLPFFFMILLPTLAYVIFLNESAMVKLYVTACTFLIFFNFLIQRAVYSELFRSFPDKR